MRLLLLNIGRNLENMGMTQRIWALIFRSNCNHRGETSVVDGCSAKSLSIIVITIRLSVVHRYDANIYIYIYAISRV
jgi:hypothetical protein